jgi:hypothetical protein
VSLTSLAAPVDLIVALDSSGSMDAEVAEVQANLPGVVTAAAAQGVDVRVVLVADASVCVPAPLGSGNCGGADEKLPGYRHVLHGVGSNNALARLVETYEQWAPSLRSGSTRSFLVVSDDESDMSASQFSTELLAKDATLSGSYFDNISASQDSDDCVFCMINGCQTCANPCCDKAQSCLPLSAEQGAVYATLALESGGATYDLCAQNFVPFFADLAADLVARAPCPSYAAPAPPLGHELSGDQVSLSLRVTSSGPLLSVPYVSGGAPACQADGWYFDDAQAPAAVSLCPSSCPAGDPPNLVQLSFECGP